MFEHKLCNGKVQVQKILKYPMQILPWLFSLNESKCYSDLNYNLNEGILRRILIIISRVTKDEVKSHKFKKPLQL